MQNAETVLDVLRERGRKGLPCEELYRQMFNKELYLKAYGRIYANHGAMTPGADGETADGMALAKIGRITDALRHERYRFQPVKRIYIPKKSGKKRPLGLPSWSVGPAPAGTPDPVMAGDDTFATVGTKTELAAMLSARQAKMVRAETALRLHLAADAAGEKAAH